MTKSGHCGTFYWQTAGIREAACVAKKTPKIIIPTQGIFQLDQYNIL